MLAPKAAAAADGGEKQGGQGTTNGLFFYTQWRFIGTTTPETSTVVAGGAKASVLFTGWWPFVAVAVSGDDG